MLILIDFFSLLQSRCFIVFDRILSGGSDDGQTRYFGNGNQCGNQYWAVCAAWWFRNTRRYARAYLYQSFEFFLLLKFHHLNKLKFISVFFQTAGAKRCWSRMGAFVLGCIRNDGIGTHILHVVLDDGQDITSVFHINYCCCPHNPVNSAYFTHLSLSNRTELPNWMKHCEFVTAIISAPSRLDPWLF